MDLNMPGISGNEATTRVLEVRPESSVLMVTINGEDAGLLEAIRAGASGYLLKDTELEDIVDAIRAAAAGSRCSHPPWPASSSRSCEAGLLSWHRRSWRSSCRSGSSRSSA
jgi:DNA-binding NarL/FixJ family response regulator